MPSDLTTAIFALTAEKDLPRDLVISAVEDALAVTYRKQYGTVPEARVQMDVESGQFTVWERRRWLSMFAIQGTR